MKWQPAHWKAPRQAQFAALFKQEARQSAKAAGEQARKVPEKAQLNPVRLKNLPAGLLQKVPQKAEAVKSQARAENNFRLSKTKIKKRL